MEKSTPAHGSVTLVGAGPGDPELLTIKAVRAIERADVVLIDDLVNPEILAYAPASARVIQVGKRAAAWCADFILDLHEIEHRLGTLRFRGAKGTTGTQASFLALFHGDHDKVRQLDNLVARKMGFAEVYPVTGQTYSRKVDSQVVGPIPLPINGSLCSEFRKRAC